MPEQVVEPKQETQEVAQPSDSEVYDQFEKSGQEKPSESSTENKPEVEETEPTEEAGADQSKKAESEEGKEEKPQDPRDLAFRKGYKEGQGKFKPRLDELEKRLEEVNKVISSPQYIRESMRSQGYKDEAINEKLKELGHPVIDKPEDDLSLISQKLNIDPNTLDDNTRSLVGDVAKITRVILDDWAAKNLSSHLKPLQEGLGQITQTQHASKLTQDMEKVVKDEGILDFKKDIEPELNKFLDENKDATQEDAFEYFKELNHTLTIERLRTGAKKKTRDESKKNLRPLKEGGTPGQPIIGDKRFSDSDIYDAIGERV